MATDQTKVASAITASVYRAALGTAAPTTQATALNVLFIEHGYIGEDGVTHTLPVSGDTTTIKAMQNGATVRTIRAAPDEQPTFTFVALETNKTALESYFGATVTQTATEGALTVNTNNLRTHYSWVIDMLDGSELEREYIPDGVVIEVGDRVYANGEPVGYEVTVEAQYNAGITGHYKFWSTRAKT